MRHLATTPFAFAFSLSLCVALVACSHTTPEPDSPPAPTAKAAGVPAPAATPTAVAPAPAPSPTPAPVESSAPVEPAAVVDAEPPELPRGTVVLHVGDSMADALGKDLKRELEAVGVRNILKAKEATYIPQWAGYSMNFPSHIATNNPDLVIVTLGGNEVGMPDPTERAGQVRKLVATIGDRPCLWIAPPLWGPHTGILNVIRENCAPCIYVDTNKLIPDLKRLEDKVHPTLPERKRWAKFMMKWLRENRDPNGKRPWDMKPGAGG